MELKQDFLLEILREINLKVKACEASRELTEVSSLLTDLGQAIKGDTYALDRVMGLISITDVYLDSMFQLGILEAEAKEAKFAKKALELASAKITELEKKPSGKTFWVVINWEQAPVFMSNDFDSCRNFVAERNLYGSYTIVKAILSKPT